jgi:hypothetical protein
MTHFELYDMYFIPLGYRIKGVFHIYLLLYVYKYLLFFSAIASSGPYDPSPKKNIINLN